MRQYTRKLYLADLSRKSLQIYEEAMADDLSDLRRLALQRGYSEPIVEGNTLDPRCRLILVRPQHQGAAYLAYFKHKTRIAEFSEIAQGHYNGDLQRSLREDIDLIGLDFLEEFKRLFLLIPLASLNLLSGSLPTITSEKQKEVRRLMHEKGLSYGPHVILSLLSEKDSMLEEEVTN
ncbi:MAG: hypothetical protein HY512_03840 [Candidatus Aenigmarchaeota archaeon]|nr:hypothetical protein [Candidatus Aenigmarchaeota archaeon]